ncbi:MAG: M20/M25/M40 family metallo-hydrolase [Planctomycetota bacterium]|jgi:N-acetylated-alpha-linked acidic dipeptidase|nr:M20/M25/M40 family metallo-hydrolase [Planctomycetota bacterium]MDP6761346.1 M20/M25/M40 family metallo-hydrolase [Planctomycetota bacterium]MDP6990841.1 M20/M25/M40 family metallo-hydrolase [Planctomycetota bacterium]
MRPPPLLLPLSLCALGANAAAASIREDPPPARELLLELTRQSRLAGTSGSRWGAEVVARRLREAGWEVELDAREVLLSLPRRLEFSVLSGESVVLERRERFDPDAHPPGDVPPFNAWSASGEVRAPVLDVGYGLSADYERLASAGVDPGGHIALARYGGSYRGIKVALATERGMVGVLLYNDPEGDGEGRGATWPVGPWKPDWAVQRGSILPMEAAPGDPSTPGWPSPAPGEPVRRLAGAELAAALPSIPCLPIPAREALALRALLEAGEPGGEAVEARLLVDQPLELRTIYNVIARLEGDGAHLVLAGNHRDAWVRGANDAGGGTVALLRAAQRLGARAARGWRPRNTLVLCFWDAEEPGLLGSTEWVEANAADLIEHAICYVNADSAVGGPHFTGASGSPGTLGALRRALLRVPAADPDGPPNLWEEWVAAAGEQGPALGLPGSGSDFAAFLHHLDLPVIDIAFHGAGGGQYHTAFDDFLLVERFLDPTWRAHELVGLFFAELLVELASRGPRSLDEAEASHTLAELVRSQASWLGPEPTRRLADAFTDLARLIERGGSPPELGEGRYYRMLAAPGGLAGRPWYTHRLWTPSRSTGYGAEVFPTLRAAREEGPSALDAELASFLAAIERIAHRRSPLRGAGR